VPILFKIFIQSQFDYCSTLIIHFSDKSNYSRLNTCFAKSIHRLLKLKLYSSTPEEQYNILFSKFNILPLMYRHFFRFCTFTFNLLISNNSLISNEIQKNISTTITRFKYKEQNFSKDVKKYSYISIALKLLNLFIADHLFINNISQFKKHLLINISQLYIDSHRFWTSYFFFLLKKNVFWKFVFNASCKANCQKITTKA
jgi:hypothetical protein